MLAELNYKGELYFSSYSELEESLHFITREITREEAHIDINRPELKLTINISEPSSKKYQVEESFQKAAQYAIAGMILVFQDNQFQDVICADRDPYFSPKRPAVLMFTLPEFEKSFGKLDMEVSDIVYDSPFYIYDISLKKTGPKFKDELPISKEDCKVGFEIIDMIWLKYVAQSSTFLYYSLFSHLQEDEGDYSIQSTNGFAPGYSMEQAIAEAKNANFLVFRWDEYWSNDNTIERL